MWGGIALFSPTTLAAFAPGGTFRGCLVALGDEGPEVPALAVLEAVGEVGYVLPLLSSLVEAPLPSMESPPISLSGAAWLLECTTELDASISNNIENRAKLLGSPGINRIICTCISRNQNTFPDFWSLAGEYLVLGIPVRK
jgi:hypothetical protein